jgi:hypothetical protein
MKYFIHVLMPLEYRKCVVEYESENVLLPVIAGFEIAKELIVEMTKCVYVGIEFFRLQEQD